MSPAAIVEELAEHHEAHLRWLRARLDGSLAADEVEDVLQSAYVRALAALSAPAPQRPQFARPAHAAGWLRTIALNQARDLLRERRGRPGGGRGSRPAHVGLDDSACTRLAADVDVEGEVLGALQRESHRSLVFEAITRLDARHRQILQLRYGRDLAPAAVMVLLGLDRRQWEGRHTRALKAFGRSLSRLQVSRECRQTRRLLRASPSALLASRDHAARDHVAACLACSAFSSVARFALASLPLPMAIEAWRLDAAEILAPPSPDRAPPSPAPAPAGPAAVAESGSVGLAGANAWAGAAAVLAVAASMVLAGLAGESSPGSTREEAPTSQPSSGLGAGQGARLADHSTGRQALERAAREAGRRHAGAERPVPSSRTASTRPSSRASSRPAAGR